MDSGKDKASEILYLISQVSLRKMLSLVRQEAEETAAVTFYGWLIKYLPHADYVLVHRMACISAASFPHATFNRLWP